MSLPFHSEYKKNGDAEMFYLMVGAIAEVRVAHLFTPNLRDGEKDKCI